MNERSRTWHMAGCLTCGWSEYKPEPPSERCPNCRLLLVVTPSGAISNWDVLAAGHAATQATRALTEAAVR